MSGYQSVKVPLKKTILEIKLEKRTFSGNNHSIDVVYDIVDSSDASEGTNIRVIKPEELPDDHDIIEFIPVRQTGENTLCFPAGSGIIEGIR